MKSGKKRLVTALVVAGVFLGGVVAGAAVQSTFFTDAQKTVETIDQLFVKGTQYKDKSSQLQMQLDQNKLESDTLRDQIVQLQKDLQGKDMTIQDKDAEIQKKTEELQKLQQEYDKKKQEAIDLSNQLDQLQQDDQSKDAKMAEIRKLAEDRLSQLN